MSEPAPKTDMTLALFGLALLNLGVYVAWQLGGAGNYRWMAAHFLVSAESVVDGRVWTLLTTTLSHTDPTHLLFNLLGLWVFGTPVERVLGPLRFAALYVTGGLAGSIGFVAWCVATGSPNAALGASGAVMAIAVVYAMWFPNRTLMINFLIPVPAWLAVLLFIAMDVYGMFGGGAMGQPVAYSAHLGGAVLGAMIGLPRLLRRRRP
jgi:membrane associated rhomboid family serine protease